MSISVVIPTYNAAALIGRTLHSVLTQTVLPDEVIVADDASTDDTVALAEAKLVGIPHRLIRCERNSGGPGEPMNRAIEAATGEWIITLDHDDELVPDRVERLVNAMPLAADCGVVIGRMIVRPESADRGHLLDAAWANVMAMTTPGEFTAIPSKTAYEALARHGCYAMSCSAMAFRKQTWIEVGGFDASVKACIDFAFLEAVLRTMPLGVIHAPVAYWTWNEHNLSHAVHQRVFDVSTVMDRIRLESPPDVARTLWQARQERAYLLTCRGEYRKALKLVRSPLTAVKCFAKAMKRQWAG